MLMLSSSRATLRGDTATQPPFKSLRFPSFSSAFSTSVLGRLDSKAQMRPSSASPTMPVQGVFFDLDDTLVPSHAADTSAHQAVARLLNSRVPHVNPQLVVDSFSMHFSSEPWDPHQQIHITEWRSQLWNRGLLALEIDDLDLARDLQSCFDAERLRLCRWVDGVELLVRKLQQKNVKVGIITNGHAEIQRKKLKACKAVDLFNVIVVGGEEPNPKPHKEIFLTACRMSGCEPEKAIMVGDNLETDIQGALNANFLATIWINVHGQEERKEGSKPHHTVNNFLELHDVLKEYGAI